MICIPLLLNTSRRGGCIFCRHHVILMLLFYGRHFNIHLFQRGFTDGQNGYEGVMNCEKCKRRDATVHLTEIIKSNKTEIHLCEKCAREIGLNSRFSNYSLSVPDMLSFLEPDEIRDVANADVCGSCGTSFIDYKKTGKLGCPECYLNLRQALLPVISGYHDGIKHIGKAPENYIGTRTPVKTRIESQAGAGASETLTDLKKKMDAAVQEEKYEEAADLRDRIRRMNDQG
jgi:protein arginine kinase activator